MFDYKAFFDLPADVKARYAFCLVSDSPLLLFATISIPACTCLRIAQAWDVMQKRNVGWDSGQQKRASHNPPELKELLQLNWHNMDGKWPTDEDIQGF